MSTLRRPFPFDVRPHHRETIDSYTDRLLAANHSDRSHQALLLAEAGITSTSARTSVWVTLMQNKTKRSTLHLEAHPSSWLTHPDGTSCVRCDDLLDIRIACTLCSHGKTIYQNPHFDTLVCIRHQRWIGLGIDPEQQHRADQSTVRAALRLEKLRRAGRVDLRLYWLLTNLIAEGTRKPASPRARSGAFAPAVALIDVLTTPDFAIRFFTPATPFADSYAYLLEIVTQITPTHAAAVTRGLWLYLRPAVASLRRSIQHATDYTPTWAHDFTIPSAVARTLTAGIDKSELEPFSKYLDVTADTPTSAAYFATRLQQVRVLSPEEATTTQARPALYDCDEGHQFEYSAPTMATAKQRNRTPFTPTCGLCTARRVSVGINDLQSQRPDIAAQFDIARNGGLTAADIAVSSKALCMWLCPNGHSHETSPFRKTISGYECPVCSNRIIIPGINCLLSSHPDIAGQWAYALNTDISPSTVSAGSNHLVYWTCPEDHTYPARVYERTAHDLDCYTCAKTETKTGTNLTVTHPEIAADWHPTYNGELQADEVTHGSGKTVWWQCPLGHDYKQRVFKRTANGYNCTVCSCRKLVPGINDLATTEPELIREYHSYLNNKQPNELFASTHRLWWRCLANRHSYQQTVQHRRETKGCPLCAPLERILANGKDETRVSEAVLHEGA